jgi:hypothetical protein
MKLQNAISRHIQGEKHEVAALPVEDGVFFWFKPKKYGYAAKEQIDELLRQMKRAVMRNPAALQILSRVEEGMSPRDLLKKLTPEETLALAEAMANQSSGDTDLLTELTKLQLLNGIGENNFSEAVLPSISEAQVELLMQDSSVVEECLEVIAKHNLPLAKSSESSS